MIKKLKIGLIGLGRLGNVYGSHLAHHVPNAHLHAVSDANKSLAKSFAKKYDVNKMYQNYSDIITDKDVDAIVVITPTSTHKEIVIDALKAGKPTFCEKPISISLNEAEQMLDIVEKTGTFFQMGFQRRFDRGYLAAKKKLEKGEIGTPVVLRSSSRDPFAPPLEFCDPKKSGGMILDMGIHDFDVARMFMGEIESVYSIGGALAYPEMKKIGDIDNAVISLYFQNGTLGVVDLSRNAVYGYDIRTEILGTKGTLKVGYLRETPVLTLTKNGVTHDVVPHFMERFGEAYLTQIQDFTNNVLKDKEPTITAQDGVKALKVSLAATKSLHENCPVKLTN
ncbi:MAG: inositol 2-dehydrogenase [Calditrichia bacterium]